MVLFCSRRHKNVSSWNVKRKLENLKNDKLKIFTTFFVISIFYSSITIELVFETIPAQFLFFIRLQKNSFHSGIRHKFHLKKSLKKVNSGYNFVFFCR